MREGSERGMLGLQDTAWVGGRIGICRVQCPTDPY